MNEQIEKQATEEMACDMCTVILNCNDPYKPIPSCHAYQHAKRAYAKGYRKQEWISVEDRMPERNGRYLTHCNIENQSLVCVLYYCKIGGVNEGTVTHWMPLPEPPKMKGGAE
jgi:hypothetical protein